VTQRRRDECHHDGTRVEEQELRRSEDVDRLLRKEVEREHVDAEVTQARVNPTGGEEAVHLTPRDAIRHEHQSVPNRPEQEAPQADDEDGADEQRRRW
jgi:hypothetical protein